MLKINLHTPQIAPVAGTFENLIWKKTLPPLGQRVAKVVYEFNFQKNQQTKTLLVQGKFSFSLEILAAYSGEVFNYQKTMPWTEEYVLEVKKANGHLNLLTQPTLLLEDYLLEFIALNLPLAPVKEHDTITKSGFDYELVS